MNKEELIVELQKINGNPIVCVGVQKSWGKQSHVVSGVTALYQHDGHKVENDAAILEIGCEDIHNLTEDQLAEMQRERIFKKYGPLANCSIDERFWAVNGPWLDKWNRETIERLQAENKRLKEECSRLSANSQKQAQPNT